jgi:hypothetical protein
MDQKVKQHRFLKYLPYHMAFTHTKKVDIQSHLLGPGFATGSGSGPRRPDLDPTKKVRIHPDKDPQHCTEVLQGEWGLYVPVYQMLFNRGDTVHYSAKI